MDTGHRDKIFQHAERHAGIVRALHLDLHQLAIGGFAEKIDAEVLYFGELSRQPANDRLAGQPPE